MADYCARELDDVVHRLLPPEIFADIGIVEGRPSAARRSHAVVEELAARLVGILGLAGKRKEHTSPPPRATPYKLEAHHSQGCGCGGMDGVGSRAHVANGGNGGMVLHAPGFGKNGTVFDSGAVRRLPRFAPIAPCAGANPPPASTGTGVFLPRADLYETRLTRASKSPGNGAKPPRLPRIDAATAMMQQQQQQVHGMAAAMEQKKEFATAFGAYHPELLALPQEWMY